MNERDRNHVQELGGTTKSTGTDIVGFQQSLANLDLGPHQQIKRPIYSRRFFIAEKQQRRNRFLPEDIRLEEDWGF